MQVTLESKCWEGDWELLLKTDRVKRLAEHHCFPFAERILMINNVNNYDDVCAYAQLAVEQGWLTRFVVVKDHAEEAMQFFRLSLESLGKGYVFSIAELVSIYICRTDFLLHFAGDVFIPHPNEWLSKALDLMAADPRIKVANPTWNERYWEARAESESETDDFFIGYGFSDQCYLVRTADFRAAIYNESHPASERYPAYGGELFEKRVDSWMRNHGWLRATCKRASYFHEARHHA
jgi:hypothetical protein